MTKLSPAFSPAFSAVSNTRAKRRIEIDLPGAAAGNFRALGERRLDRGQRRARIAAGAVDQARGEPFGVVEQDLQQMLGRKLLMALALRERLGGLNETAAAVGIFFEIHVFSLGLSRRPLTAQPEHRHWVINTARQFREKSRLPTPVADPLKAIHRMKYGGESGREKRRRGFWPGRNAAL